MAEERVCWEEEGEEVLAQSKNRVCNHTSGYLANTMIYQGVRTCKVHPTFGLPCPRCRK